MGDEERGTGEDGNVEILMGGRRNY